MVNTKFVDANHVPYTPTRWLSYDDVLLMPQASDLESRNDKRISLATRLTAGTTIQVPIISANMDTVTGAGMSIAMHRLGGHGIMHRFYKSQDAWWQDIKTAAEITRLPSFSIGANPDDLDMVNMVVKEYGQAVVCVDIAHGHLQKCLTQVVELNKMFRGQIQIIAGNIATPAAAAALVQAGADAVKVGIGNSGICSTRLVSGHGIPQLSAIMQIRRALYGMQTNTTLIADGGIRTSGDIVKALAAGANSVMVGNLFAGTDETPGDILADGDKRYKVYRGQSSQAFLDDRGKSGVSAEGIDIRVPVKGSVMHVLNNLIGGVRSGFTYSGASSIVELYNKAIFVEVSENGLKESQTYYAAN